VRKKEVLYSAKEDRNVLHTVKKRKATWIGHILHRNFLLNLASEGKIAGRTDMKETQERRCKRLVDDIKETRRCTRLQSMGELALEDAMDLS
jgi:hypothetical protein